MADTQAEFHLSPSINHHFLMNRNKPALQYDGGDVAQWQNTLRAKLRELIGNMPEERVPLNVRSLWKRDHELGSIEKIVFTSEPYADVPAYVCLPKNAQQPYRFFICLQGHTSGMHHSIGVQQDDETQPMAVQGDRDFAIGAMQRGLAALCIEQRAFGERSEKQLEKDFGHCHDATMHALMLGRTMCGERVWDVDRAIDYLESRGDVDMNRLGVMGNSGGGTISLFSAALLPRVRLAMPSCYFCTFKHSVMSIGHCVDNYIPNLINFAEMPDVLGLFAPRPVVAVAGQHDDIFPIEGVYEAFEHLKKIYRAAGAEENCKLVVGPEGHRFYAEQGWAAMMPFIEAGGQQ